MATRGGDRASTHEGRYVIDPVEYVHPSPPLATSLFDDRERLDRLLKLAVESLAVERSEEDERRITEEVRALKESQDEEKESQDRTDGGRRSEGN